GQADGRGGGGGSRGGHAGERRLVGGKGDGGTGTCQTEPGKGGRIRSEGQPAGQAISRQRLAEREPAADGPEADAQASVHPAEDHQLSVATKGRGRAGSEISRRLSAAVRTADASASEARPSAPSSAGRRPLATQSTNSQSSATYISFVSTGTRSSFHPTSSDRRHRTDCAVESQARLPSEPITSQ